MSPFIWLGVAAVMGIVEVLSLGLITMWFVIGALVAFLANLLGFDLVAQLVVFFLVSIVCLIVLRPVFVKYRKRGETEEPDVVGQSAIVIEGCIATASRTPSLRSRIFRRRRCATSSETWTLIRRSSRVTW